MKLQYLPVLILLTAQCFSLPITKRSETINREESSDASVSPDTSSAGSGEVSLSPTEPANLDMQGSDDNDTELVSACTPLPTPSASSPTPENTTAASASNISSTTSALPTVEPTSHSPTGANVSLDFEAVAMDVTESAAHTWQAARDYTRNILTDFLDGDRPRPRPSCFLIERESTDRRTQHSIDYVQRFIEDYNSLQGYYSYTEQVETTVNETSTHSIRFTDLKNSLTQLRENMASLFSILNRCTEEELRDDSGMELQLRLPDFCTDTSYEQQYRVYLRCDVFARVYIPSDITGLLESIKNCGATK
jgi:hypothetical protein